MSELFKTYSAIPDTIKNQTFIHPQDKHITDRSLDGFRLPGLIDIHLHGAYGWDFSFGDPQKIENLFDQLLAQGLTGIIPTLITCNEDQRLQALRDISTAVRQRKSLLPVIHGIHLEGPFLAAEKRGSHPVDCLVPPSMRMFEEWQKAADGLIRLITVAPELPGAIEFIRQVSKEGVIVSIGHSGADWKTTQQAMDAGARHVTHLFNAMPQLHHREPNFLSCVLTNRKLSVEIIGDCEHVAPEMVNFVYSVYENDQVILTSDAVATAGLPDGEHQLYGNTLNKTGARCCLGNNKLFGGSTLLNHCLKRLSEETLISWGILGTSVWRNPCRLMGIEPPDTEVFYDQQMNWLASRLDNIWYCKN